MTPKKLIKAAHDGKSVIGFHAIGSSPMPAAFIASMQFRIVVALLPHMSVYKPRKDKWSKAPWKRKSI